MRDIAMVPIDTGRSGSLPVGRGEGVQVTPGGHRGATRGVQGTALGLQPPLKTASGQLLQPDPFGFRGLLNFPCVPRSPS